MYFESDFLFKFHHKKILNKSYRILGFVIRNTQNFKQPSSLIYIARLFDLPKSLDPLFGLKTYLHT